VPNPILFAIFLCILPIAELRGGIPFAIFNGIDPIIAFVICVVSNALVGPLVFLFLSTFHKLFSKWEPYNRLFEKFVTRARNKLHKEVEKYGYIGIAIFVAIPLPLTGAYTGALGAWVLGMDTKKSILAVALGVLVAGIVVTIVVVGGRTTFSFLYDIFVNPPK
jgi:uncharacterized membrane protein